MTEATLYIFSGYIKHFLYLHYTLSVPILHIFVATLYIAVATLHPLATLYMSVATV